MSEEEWPSDKYPPWAHGAGYVLSADLAAQVASGAVGLCWVVWLGASWQGQVASGAALVS